MKTSTSVMFVQASAASRATASMPRRWNEVVRAGDALTDTLTEKQKENFENYMAARREVNVLTDCETFIYSFRLAAKIMIIGWRKAIKLFAAQLCCAAKQHSCFAIYSLQ